MTKAVVVGSFTIEYDMDRAREDWGEPDLTDGDVLEEFIGSVKDNWDFWATAPEVVSVDGYLSDD